MYKKMGQNWKRNTETQRLWNIETEVIPVKIGETETIPKSENI
jgi:hypothetical protein